MEKKNKEGAVVVDVRTEDEYMDEHFPKALIIPGHGGFRASTAFETKGAWN